MKTLKLESGKRGGSALIIVLASLVFVSALTIAFLMSMRSKLILSKSGSDANNVKMLAETAVNIAISQVRDATKKAGTNSLAWASQPGMVRLYNDSGRAAGYYKLYSADNLVADSGAFDPASEADLLDDWASAPAVFTDLNAPANGVFPIVDYAAATSLGVQGFSLGTVPGATASQPAPMPVKWLYVLEDGSLYTADPSSSGTSVVISAATSANPIVGRIAFWTDDETCKVNVNTASEGMFWSTPRFNTTGDRDLAIYQPARGEYQRYPGHPATVSLKSLFPSLTSQQIFSIAPRLSWGGSEGGKKAVQDVATWIDTDRDRLYDSMDEVLFTGTSTGTARSVQDGLTLPMVKASRFFLTANSRAPELNLYGLPRITTWPIHAVNDNNYRTVNDRLLAFCSTLGNTATSGTSYPFYFTREQNVDPTHDIALPRNKDLLDYLDRLTGQQIPGFGGTFQDKYPNPETRQILTEIFDYIRCTNLFDRTTLQNPTGFWPYAFGISSRFEKGAPRRWDGSSLGTAVPAYHETWKTRGFGGRFLQIRAAHIHFVGLGDSSNPIDANQTGTLVNIPDKNHVPIGKTAVQAYIYLSTLTPSEGVEFWSPGHWIEIEGLDKFGIRLKPTDAEYTKLGFPEDGEMTIMGNMLGGGGIAGGRVASLEPFGFTIGQNVPKKLAYTAADSRYQFPFFSAILPVDATSSTMDFQGGTIIIKIYADAPAQGNGPFKHADTPIETFVLTFPDATFPTPLLAAKRLVGSGDTNSNRWNSRSGYFESGKDVLRSVSLEKGDVRLVVGPTVVTTSTTTAIPVTVTTSTSSFYAVPKGSDYFDITKRMVPAVSDADLIRRGKLVAGADYNQNPPLVPDQLDGVYTDNGALGDWDNGTSVVGDGPFINAADPGSITPINASVTPAYFDNSAEMASTNTNFFSPNRQMPGPGMFGSLSTGVQRNRPWQTLLFRPGPPNHPGLGSPISGPPYTKLPDHLLLDLFWMPVVEPYAISEPFSTAGKINMNQQLVPFTYIDRMAGLRAALVAEKVAMVKKSDANAYKTNTPASIESRKGLNLSETNGTLRQFKEKFDSGEIFRSATEICDIYLVPDGQSWTSDSYAQSAWYSDDFAMVGDNTRERPYAHLYNKLTTKSNTFTVHYHVQILQKSKTRNLSAPTVFDPGKGDKVVADQRGTTTFERYLDPADARIVKPDPASSGATSLEQYYRARIINTSVFNP